MRPIVMEPSEGVFHVQGVRTNWQLLVDGDAVTLVDAGWPRDFALIERSLADIGRKPVDVRAILLTHAHRDHLGTAAEFIRRFGTRVRTHVDEAPHVRGEVVEEISPWALLARVWRPSGLLLVFTILRHGAAGIERVPNVDTFEDGDTLDVPGQPKAIATPGHTSGHCAFHLPERGVLISGDALVTRNLLHRGHHLGAMPPEFDHDPARSVESLRRLAGLKAHVVLPGHGGVYPGSPAEAVHEALAARS